MCVCEEERREKRERGEERERRKREREGGGRSEFYGNVDVSIKQFLKKLYEFSEKILRAYEPQKILKKLNFLSIKPKITNKVFGFLITNKYV